MLKYVGLSPGVYNLYGSKKIFKWEYSKPYIGSIKVNEDGSYMTTSATTYHYSLSSFPALYFYLHDNGEFNLDRNFMKYISFRFFILYEKDKITSAINLLKQHLKDVKYIIKYN